MHTLRFQPGHTQDLLDAVRKAIELGLDVSLLTSRLDYDPDGEYEDHFRTYKRTEYVLQISEPGPYIPVLDQNQEVTV